MSDPCDHRLLIQLVCSLLLEATAVQLDDATSKHDARSKLAEMLDNAALNQECEVQSFAEMAVGIFEPVLILVMGGVVLTIVLVILMPIFDMNQLIQ